MKGAIEFQKSLLSYLCLENRFKNFKSICSFDISYDKSSRKNFAVAILLSYIKLEEVERSVIVEKADFPYVPGLLAFREGPAIVKVFKKLRNKPDLLLFDGHGIAHPRGMGIASMIGILLDRPSIGCAKSRLVGDFTEPAQMKGSISDLLYKGRKVGHVLRSRDKVKPIFVSAGHLIELDMATDIVLRCCHRYRLPKPVRMAHRLANQVRMDSNRMES
ncbi:MAG: endonuclease V [Candidatus Zixiibacteriota bacterium]|nr:MAG: endonuclease V [candidate division Zixibacteria bacterium]